MFQKQALTDDEKCMKNQILLDRELVRLKKEFTILEKCRPYLKGARHLKNKRLFEVFIREREEIHRDLKRATDPGTVRKNEKIFYSLEEELQSYSLFDMTVQKRKKYLEEIEAEIKESKKTVVRLRRQQITENHWEQHCRTAVKTLETLENRLELQMRKFGTICTKNKELRAEIDCLISDRRIFMKLWSRLIQKLCKGKQIISDLIEQASIAHCQAIDAYKKVIHLSNKVFQDHKNNVQSMSGYKAKLDQYLKVQDFFLTKQQRRLMKGLEDQIQQKRIARQLVIKEKLAKYTNIFREIKNFTGETQMEAIAKNFARQEELNMSSFNYIIEMISDMETDGDNLGRLQLEIAETQHLHDDRIIQQETTLIDLEGKLEDTRAEARCAEEELDKVETQFKDLLNGVEKLFRICKCDRDPFLQLLGNNTSVKFYNVDFYIQILESKIQELLIGAGYHDLGEKKKNADTDKFLLRFEPTRNQNDRIYSIDEVNSPCSLCVEHEMVTDVIDTVQYVMSREQVKHALQHQLKLPASYARLHKVSDCQLPKSRKIIQKKYEV